MQTTHRLHIGDARNLSGIADASVQLVVTSPPYPMIAMWDDAFGVLAPTVPELLASGHGLDAFEAMHFALDEVWAECARALAPGGFLCINIGDATRTLGEEFCLYPNHARILMALTRLGLTTLPDILWRKPSNAPNKFMGSGMLPAGAYVTYEHEYVLIARKGGKREFTGEEKAVRGASAYFWEERNAWFSDLWSDVRGTRQKLGGDALRERSAAFPFELPYRLVNMYSVQGDTVLDPFVGTGTTMAAAFSCGRSSIGVDVAGGLEPLVAASLAAAVPEGRARAEARLAGHAAFMAARAAEGKVAAHASAAYGFAVVTGQERALRLQVPAGLRPAGAGAWEGACEPLAWDAPPPAIEAGGPAPAPALALALAPAAALGAHTAGLKAPGGA